MFYRMENVHIVHGIEENEITWAPEATKELKKIPFFVRGKAKRNTEKFAFENGHSAITKDLLYEAKAHYAR